VIAFGFALGILGGDERELCFFQHEICGQFVVNLWFLCGFWLVGNDDDKDRGELCVVDQFGVTEVSENCDFAGNAEAVLHPATSNNNKG